MKTMHIDEFLTWAFTHELAKGGGIDGVAGPASAWAKIAGLAELGTIVDMPKGERSGFILEQSEPHGDAVKAGEAVAEIGRWRWSAVAWDAETLCGDWLDGLPASQHAMLRQAAAEVRQRYAARSQRETAHHIVALVIGHAILGREPEWRAEQPKARFAMRGGRHLWYTAETVTDRNGEAHVIEHEAVRNPKTHRPPNGAYRKLVFDHSPVADLMGRADWMIWRVALDDIACLLRDNLQSYHVTVPAGWMVRPWDGGLVPGVTVARREAELFS